jgi:hypothetical protein
MLPYDQIEAMSVQRMNGYRTEAENHRLLARPGADNRVVGLLRTGLERSGLRRIGQILSGRPTRPLQPAI